MEIGAIFLLLAVLVFTALFIARPFMERGRTTTVSAEEQELSSLMAERDRLITALQELDFDHALGKIPSEDYPGMRATLLQQASDVLRRMDAFQPQITNTTDAESRVEAVIAARRADASVQKSEKHEVSDDDLEDLVASRRAARKEKSAGFCPKCGKPILRTDRFCPHCGKAIK
jgi:rubrerythrin